MPDSGAGGKDTSSHEDNIKRELLIDKERKSKSDSESSPTKLKVQSEVYKAITESTATVTEQTQQQKLKKQIKKYPHTSKTQVDESPQKLSEHPNFLSPMVEPKNQEQRQELDKHQEILKKRASSSPPSLSRRH